MTNDILWIFCPLNECPLVPIPNLIEPIPDLLNCPTMVLQRIYDLSSGVDLLGDEKFVKVHIRHVDEVETIFKHAYVLGKE